MLVLVSFTHSFEAWEVICLFVLRNTCLAFWAGRDLFYERGAHNTHFEQMLNGQELITVFGRKLSPKLNVAV